MTPGKSLPFWASVSPSMQGCPEGFCSSDQRMCPPPACRWGAAPPGVSTEWRHRWPPPQGAHSPRESGCVPETTSFWETPAAQCFPWSDLEDSHPPGSHLGSIWGLGRLDVAQCAVSPVIWGLKPAEVRMGNCVCRAIYRKSSEKGSNENQLKIPQP